MDNPRIQRLIWCIQRTRSINAENGLEWFNEEHWMTSEAGLQGLEEKAEKGIELSLQNIHGFYVLAKHNPNIASVMMFFDLASGRVNDFDVQSDRINAAMRTAIAEGNI